MAIVHDNESDAILSGFTVASLTSATKSNTVKPGKVILSYKCLVIHVVSMDILLKSLLRSRLLLSI